MPDEIFSKESYLGSFSWEYLPWDTKILNRKTAKILSFEPKRDAKKLLNALIKSFEKRKIQYATFRISASDFAMIHVLEDGNFKLVDGYIKLECGVKNTENFPSNIREVKKDDFPNLKEIASSSFSKTRFYNDPLIKKTQADKIYSEWIKNSILGKMADMVLVWEEDGKLLGFVTIRKNGNLTLIAVSKDAQGKGIGKLLIKAALTQFKKWGVLRSTVETQMTNTAALRAYQFCGYKIKDSYLTFRYAN